ASNKRRPIQVEGTTKGKYRLDVEIRTEFVFLVLPTFGRVRLAVPRHVECQDTETRCDFVVAQHMAILATISAGRMQANQRYAAAGFLKVNPAATARHVKRNVATDNRFEVGLHMEDSRPRASRSFMN